MIQSRTLVVRELLGENLMLRHVPLPSLLLLILVTDSARLFAQPDLIVHQRIGSLRSVNPYNPFLGMWIALTRQPRRSDQPLHAEHSITREQALRLYTINNAWLTFDERNKGSIEVGKLADFVVLNADILTCPIDEIRSITVNATYVGGKCVYSKP